MGLQNGAVHIPSAVAAWFWSLLRRLSPPWYARHAPAVLVLLLSPVGDESTSSSEASQASSAPNPAHYIVPWGTPESYVGAMCGVSSPPWDAQATQANSRRGGNVEMKADMDLAHGAPRSRSSMLPPTQSLSRVGERKAVTATPWIQGSCCLPGKWLFAPRLSEALSPRPEQPVVPAIGLGRLEVRAEPADGCCEQTISPTSDMRNIAYLWGRSSSSHQPSRSPPQVDEPKGGTQA